MDRRRFLYQAGAEIGPQAVWSPRDIEPVAVKNGVPHIHIPAASGALVLVS